MGSDVHKQHVTEAIFRIDEQGRQLSTAELGLPLSDQEREETSDYQIASLADGGMGLVFNKMRWEPPRDESYLGSYFAALQTDGTAGPLHQVAGPNVENSSFMSMTNGDLFLGGGLGVLLTFDSAGVVRRRKLFDHPILTNFASTNLSDGRVCVSAWTMARSRVLDKELRVMQLDQRGNVLRTADVEALRGQVAGGPDGSCAVLYDRDPSVRKDEYHLTVLDRSFNRQWTVPVSQTSESGAEFHLVTVREGYLAQIGEVLVEYNWSGKEIWSETTGAWPTIVVPNADGFFILSNGRPGEMGFHVMRVATARE